MVEVGTRRAVDRRRGRERRLIVMGTGRMAIHRTNSRITLWQVTVVPMAIVLKVVTILLLETTMNSCLQIERIEFGPQGCSNS